MGAIPFGGFPFEVPSHDPGGEREGHVSGVAAFAGSFDVAQAERLLWRAGFGPRKGEAEALAQLGLDGAVHALTYPDREQLVGPAPTDEKGRPLAPYDAWGHDHVWWLDRMVRTSRPLVERMTLVWHDWFATSNDGVDSQRLMLNQNQLFREHGLGAFPDLLGQVTKDPAMLLWLNGSDNSKWSPNENYAREMLELFTLGAGRGYTESDVRQNARALTGFRNDWKRASARSTSATTRARTTPAPRRSSTSAAPSPGRTRSGSRSRTSHPSFFVNKLWGYFVPTPPDAATRRALERVYVGSGKRIKPVVDGDPQASRVVQRAADGQVAGRLQRGPAAPARPRRRHDRVCVARRDGGPAPLLSAERRRLGRRAGSTRRRGAAAGGSRPTC